MDKKLREDILAEVRTAMREIAETYDEKYVTGKELCKQIAMFSPTGWRTMDGSCRGSASK